MQEQILLTAQGHEKIQQELGWNAKINLDEGLKKTIEFFKNNNL